MEPCLALGLKSDEASVGRGRKSPLSLVSPTLLPIQGFFLDNKPQSVN